MVSMINLELHKEVHSKLVQRKHPTLLWDSPFDNAWVGFILSNHKVRDEIILNEILSYFDRWICSTSIFEILKEERNIGTLSLYVGIAYNLGSKKYVKEIQNFIKERIIELNKKERWKFGVFNSPEIFYSVVAGLTISETLKEDNDFKTILLNRAVNEAKNNWFNKIHRFVLYSAALLELETKHSMTSKIIKFLASTNVRELNVDETIPLLWLIVKYGEKILESQNNPTIQKLIEDKKEDLWKQFENQRIYFSYDLQQLPEDIEPEVKAIYSLSTFELAMIDDLLASLEKIYKIDPNIVFNLLNLHPVIRKTSEKLFKDGHYSQAIFEAYKALINHVKERSKKKTLDGQELMRKVFDVEYDRKTLKITRKPILQLNDLQTREDMDEQIGFMHLFLGAVEGIRNPKAHGIIDQKDPFKTLEYLSFASLLAKRVDEAKLNLEG